MTLHVYEELEQRSPEWYAARAGIVTASAIGTLLHVTSPGPQYYDCPECGALAMFPCVSKSTKELKAIKTHHGARSSEAAKGAASADPIITFAETDTARAYLMTLAAERIANNVEDSYTTFAMQRGVDDEPYARDAYADHMGVTVREVGFMVLEDNGVRLGYSPDGLVRDDGSVEIKSRNQPRQLAVILDDDVPAEYMAQIQCGLLVSGRKWCDLVCYRDGMHLYIKRVYPDPVWHNAIRHAVVEAERRITDMVTTYHANTKGLPHIEKRPDLDDII